jgi:hypothetical protein
MAIALMGRPDVVDDDPLPEQASLTLIHFRTARASHELRLSQGANDSCEAEVHS